MKLAKVTGTNIKGQTFTHALGAFTLITGRNGSGKTAIVDAITLAGLGHIPRLGKTNAATMQLAKGTTMEATIVADDGSRTTRTWKRAGKSITCKATVDEVKLDPALLNAALFMDANATQRAALIRERFPSAADPREEILTAIRAVENLPTFELTAAPADLTEWIEAAEDELARLQSEAAGSKKRMVQTIQGITALALADDDAPARAAETLTAAHAALVAAQTAHAGIEKTIRDLEAERTNMENQGRQLGNIPAMEPVETVRESVRTRVAELRKQRQTLQAQMDEATREARARQTKRQRLAQLEAQERDWATKLPEDYTPPAERPQADRHLLKQAAENARGDERDAERAYDRAETAHGRAVEALEQAEQDAQAEGHTCPHCGADKEHWGADYAATREKEMQELRAAVDATKRALVDAELARNTTAALYKEAEAASAAAWTAHEHWDAYSVLASIRPEMETLRTELAQPGKDGQHIAEEIDDLDTQISDIEDQLPKAEAWAELSRIKAAAAQVIRNHGAALAELEPAAQKLAQARDEYARAQEAKTRADAAAQDAKRKTEAEAEADNAEKEEKAYKEARKVLQEQAQAVAAKALGPVLELASYFTDGLIPTPIAARGLEIGRWDGPSWVALDVFSGSEQAITLAAIQAGLAASTASRILILDEIGRMDEPTRARLLSRIADGLEAGKLDQAIVLIPTAEPGNYGLPGLTVIQK